MVQEIYSTLYLDNEGIQHKWPYPDRGLILVDGRGTFSYKYIPPEGQSNKQAIFLPLLKNTNDQLFEVDDQAFFKLENNLHPFVHLSHNRNLFIFSNNYSILLDPEI